MLLRISLIVAILAGIGAGVVSYLELSDKIPMLQKQRDDEQTAKKKVMSDLSTTNNYLKKTIATLKQTQGELADTKADRDKQIARADAQAKKADALADKLAKATEERNAAQNELAQYKASDLTPEQVVKLNKNLKDANLAIEGIKGELALITRDRDKFKAKLERLIGTSPDVLLRPDLQGKILIVDPKWDFVVLDIGEEQGVITDGEMLVSRAGKLVAKVVVRSVQKDRCIANLVPGWKLGDMIEGDLVTPAHPAS
jgi:hypothetical protein